jgi:hypothetical protein
LLETDLGDLNPDDHHFARHKPKHAEDVSTDPHSVNFEPQTIAESMELCNKIEDDLMARNLDIVNLEELHEMLI